MRLKCVFVLTIAVVLLVIVCTLQPVFKMYYGQKPPMPPPNEDRSPSQPADICENCDQKPPMPPPNEDRSPSQPADICENCEKEIEKVLNIYSQTWTKDEDNHQLLKSQLRSKCNGFEKAVLTQQNTPLRSVLVYDGDKTITNVKEEIFNTFAKTHPFSNTSLGTCAVVGNAGILSNSSCGEAIDSAQFVIRCNIPPLDGEFTKDVGTKTNIVTSNPSIVIEKYGSLLKQQQPFVDHARVYGNAMLLLPTFSYSDSTEVLLRVFSTIQNFDLQTQPLSINPHYLQNLDEFWRSHGLNPKKRLTTGLMMTSLAVEICDDVHLFGFWPFDQHPHTKQPIIHHYYDNMRPKLGVHSMPAEFELLLQLHRKGILKLHLGQCPPPRT